MNTLLPVLRTIKRSYDHEGLFRVLLMAFKGVIKRVIKGIHIEFFKM